MDSKFCNKKVKTISNIIAFDIGYDTKNFKDLVSIEILEDYEAHDHVQRMFIEGWEGKENKGFFYF